ncbi:Protein of unknown function [Bacillus cytotoxicus]|uniref:Uncharacterized protein n=1 Tax=Bacillus cytotoxicus TaxID=580165 RepID=A0AAX2CGV8_9BACI|nr:Protein of unknown function [Bacillus cytotoxicus]
MGVGVVEVAVAAADVVSAALVVSVVLIAGTGGFSFNF